jgi:nucleoside-diphosphate-sugar epimerase
MHKIIIEDCESIANSNLPWEKLNGKTVLISGANGYVPAYFVYGFMARNDLYKSDIKVIALCRNEKRAKERFSEYLGRDDFKLCIQDVCEPIQLTEEIHYFIHAASPAGVKISNVEPVATFTANVIGCRNMLELCIKNKTEKFLLLSSIDVYGNISPSKRFDEADSGALDSLNPRNAYAIAKRASENLCVCYFAQYKVPVVIARPSQIMGGGVALDDGRLHIDFISQMLSSSKIVLKSDGSAKRTFIYITDAITGMLTVLLKGMQGEAYNVVDENCEATVLELANLMASLAQDKKAEVVFDYDKRNSLEVTNAVSCVTGGSEKLRGLGWKPELALRGSAARMMSYYGV